MQWQQYAIRNLARDDFSFVKTATIPPIRVGNAHIDVPMTGIEYREQER
jgi:hypothetical protein